MERKAVMDESAELLNYVYQNSQMGVTTISQVKSIVEDEELSKHLDMQLKEYQQIQDAAKKRLYERETEQKDVSNMAKVSSHLTIGMKTFTDKRPSNISEMMIQGSTMGVIQATKNKSKYKNVDRDAIKLNEKLLCTEQNNIDKLKKFL
jgi:hypothetical protein